MVNLLEPGGHLLLTFGGKNRAEHEIDSAPVAQYYRGLDSSEVYRKLAHKFRVVHIWDDENDVYMWCEDKK